MGKEFICEIDGQRFLTKKEMEDYISAKYIRIVKKEIQLEMVNEELQKEFPEFIVETSTDHDFLEELGFDYTRSGFGDFPVIYVHLQSKTYQGNIAFAITSSYEENFNQDLRVYFSIEDAIKFTRIFLTAANECAFKMEKMAKRYESNLESIQLKKTEEYHYYGTHEVYLSYHAVYEDGRNVSYTMITLNLEALETPEVLNDFLEKSVKGLEARYVDVVEGYVEKKEVEDYYTIKYVYEVNGISAEELADRAEKLRITILE